MNRAFHDRRARALAALSTRALWCCAVWTAAHAPAQAKSARRARTEQRQALSQLRSAARTASQPPS